MSTKRGRPKLYEQADFEDEVCDWVSQGKTLRAFGRIEGNPSAWTVYAWLDNDADFSQRFARARAVGFDVIADEALAIADETELGETVTEDKDGRKVVTGDMLGHRRLRVEARLKLLAKWDPKRYGDRQHIEHSVDDELAVRLERARQRLDADAED